MRHEAGLHRLWRKVKQEESHLANIKNNSIGKIIEEDTPIFSPDGPRKYHTLTRDWIANEIFRRVSENQLTMGEYLRKMNCEIGTNILCGLTNADFINHKIKNIQPIGK